MKKINVLIVLAFLLSSLSPALPALADGDPYIIKSTKPISSTLREQLDAWLAVAPPSSAPYYIVTYTRYKGDNTIVSLAGVNLSSPEQPWSFEDGTTTVWLGSIIVSPNGDVSYPEERASAPAKVLAMPNPANGGGPYIAFPFASGFSVQYGPKGVHAAGYSTSGMVAVDLVSGDDMGATSAPPYAYAADAGVIDVVCDDGVSVAVRTYNETTGDYFIYAHMLDNANLEVDTEFSQGQLIGALKYGSFAPDSPNCGYAEQKANHYHLHWGFAPANNQYQVGSCILTISTQVWQCGGSTIRIGGFLTGGGGGSTGAGSTSGDGEDTGSPGGAGSVVTDPTFWDYILAGTLSIVDVGLLKLLPSHKPFEYTYMVFNVISLFFRLVWVFAASNVSLVWLFRVILFGLGVKAIFGLIWFVAFLFKMWKSLVPMLGA